MSNPLHVTFICSGNICRSPMAEKMFAHQINERGLSDDVRVTSAGTGGWHVGDAADNRAGHVLREHGYPTRHHAALIDDDHLSADLIVALGRNHARVLREMGVAPSRIRMLRSFDPRSGAHALHAGVLTDQDSTTAIAGEYPAGGPSEPQTELRRDRHFTHASADSVGAEVFPRHVTSP